MTLALLLTAVTGAWAQSTFGVKEITADMLPASWSTDESAVTADDLAKLGFMEVTKAEAQAWTGAPQKGNVRLIYTVCKSVNWVDGEGGYVTDPYTRKIFYSCLNGQRIFITTELTEWSLTPNADKKVWTLDKMPGNDIELQVEYFAESNLFLSKDALADKANISVLNGETKVEFGDNGKSTATVLEGNTITAKFTGTKKVIGMTVAKTAGNTYLKWNTDQKKLVATEIPAEVTTVTNADTNVEWAAGTYVVEGNVEINGKITLNGAVDLIIKDGAKLTVNNYIYGGSSKHNLSIYGQANKTGQLVVNCSDDNAIKNITTLEVHSCQVKATSLADACGGFNNIGTINVYGGSVDAECTGTNGFGIWLLYNGSINIYGGDVKAVGKGTNPDRCGILGTSTVTVYSGKLWAENADNKALRSGVTLTKGAGFSGKIEYSSDKSTWSEAVDTNAKYVRAGY